MWANVEFCHGITRRCWQQTITEVKKTNSSKWISKEKVWFVWVCLMEFSHLNLNSLFLFIFLANNWLYFICVLSCVCQFSWNKIYNDIWSFHSINLQEYGANCTTNLSHFSSIIFTTMLIMLSQSSNNIYCELFESNLETTIERSESHQGISFDENSNINHLEKVSLNLEKSFQWRNSITIDWAWAIINISWNAANPSQSSIPSDRSEIWIASPARIVMLSISSSEEREKDNVIKMNNSTMLVRCCIHPHSSTPLEEEVTEKLSEMNFWCSTDFCALRWDLMVCNFPNTYHLASLVYTPERKADEENLICVIKYFEEIGWSFFYFLHE